MRAKDGLRTLIAGGTTVVMLGCSDKGGVTQPELCTSPVELTVGAGVQPSLTWEPSCAATSILVRESESPLAGLFWSVSSIRGLTPPVRIGISPPAGEGYSPGPVTLTAGRSYMAIVQPSNLEAGLGVLTFTAKP